MSNKVTTRKDIENNNNKEIARVLKNRYEYNDYINTYRVLRSKVLNDLSKYYERYYFVDVDALEWLDCVLIGRALESSVPTMPYYNCAIVNYLDNSESASRMDYVNTIMDFVDTVYNDVEEIVGAMQDNYLVYAYEKAMELFKYVYDEMLSVRDFAAMYHEYHG